MTELCHEAVPDRSMIVDSSKPCDQPAVGWRIDPEGNQPYPVCETHHRWPYADDWVDLQIDMARVQAVLSAGSPFQPGSLSAIGYITALATVRRAIHDAWPCDEVESPTSSTPT